MQIPKTNNTGKKRGWRAATLLSAILIAAFLSLTATAPNPYPAAAQTQPAPQWRTVLGGPNDEFAHAVALANDGGYVIAGETRSHGAGSQDGWLVKLNAQGQQLWAKAYGGPESDVIYAVQRTSDGGYILAGATRSLPNAASGPPGRGTPQSDFWLIKTAPNGAVQWQRSYGNSEQPRPPAMGTTSDIAHAVRQTRDGGYILAGSSAGSSGVGVWLLRTSPDGTLLWSRNPGAATAAVAYDVAQTPDGGFVIAGRSGSPNRGTDALLIKTDADGNTAWTKYIGGRYNDDARSLVLTADGGYALAGFTWSDSAGLSDFWLVKTAANGARQWQRSFGGVARDAAHSLIHTSDGGFALAGWSESFSGGGRFWVIKTGPSGILQWSQAYPQTPLANTPPNGLSAGARAIAQTEDNGFIIAGWAEAIQGPRDILAVKTAPVGDRPPAAPGPVVTLQNTGPSPITSAAVQFAPPSGPPLRFWRNGRLLDRDNPLPAGATACTQPAPWLLSGATLTLDQIGAFESVYLNALSGQSPPPTAQINGTAIPFNFPADGIAGNFAVVFPSPCERSDRLLAEGPSAPVNLSAAVSETYPGAIALDWSDSPAADVSGYAVYYARKSSGPFPVLFRQMAWMLPESAYTDFGPGDGATYYYAVSAINPRGLESPKSAVASVTSLDVTPPEPPTGLRLVTADRAAGRARLEWNISSGDVIKGYRLYRQDGDGPTAPITGLLFGPRFEDWSLPKTGDFTYSVTAIDLSGNESQPSAIAPPELDFFGDVLEVRRNFTGGGRLIVNTNRGRVDVTILPTTEISVPNRPNARLDALELGDPVAVILNADGQAAQQVHLVPSQTRNRHLAGRVIRLSETEIVIQPTAPASQQVTLPLSGSAQIKLHRGVTELAANAFVIVSYLPADAQSPPTVKEINVIPAHQPPAPDETGAPPQPPGNVAVLRGVFQGISPENASLILSSIPISLDTHTVMAAGLSVGEDVVVEALLLPDGSLLARRVAQDDGAGQIAARTVLRGVYQSRDPSFDTTGAGNWTISGATVLVDRRTYTDALPRPGQRVKVSAILRDDGSLHAREIETQTDSEPSQGQHTVWLEGVFRQITPAGAWNVGGIPVEVNASTVLSGRPSVGRRVAVTATHRNGTLLAAQVSAAPSDATQPIRAATIRGIVQREPDGAKLVVDGITIALSGLTKTLGNIRVGSTVTVKAEIQTDGSLIAREVAETGPEDETGETRANPVDIEGRIERVEADGGLLVNGIPVTISALTEIDPALKYGIFVGAPVQVRGLLQRDGSVLAREILGYGPDVTGGTEAAIEGVITGIATDPDGQVSGFVIDGIPVAIDRLTRIEPELAAGVAVSVQAIVIGGQILAVTVESQPLGNIGVIPRVQMQGVVENMPSSPVPLPLDVTVNGVTVRISVGTRITGSLTPGAVIKATGRISNGVFQAQQIERIDAHAYQDADPPARFNIQGILQEARLDSEGRPDNLLVSGERIIVEPLTVFHNQVFVGDTVSVQGVITNATLIATQITLNQSATNPPQP